MTTQLSLIPAEPDVRIDHGQVLTTSINIAQVFGREHCNVLRAIKNLECSEDFRRLNFAATSVTIPQPNGGTRQGPAYDLTFDGFTLVVMGFTGREAMKYKEAYIKAFNRMAEALRRLREGVAAAPAPETVTLALADYAALQAKINGLLEDKIRLLEIEKATQPRRRNLTPAEKRQIAALAAQGFGPAHIARETGRSVATIETHLRQSRQGGAA